MRYDVELVQAWTCGCAHFYLQVHVMTAGLKRKRASDTGSRKVSYLSVHIYNR